MLREIRSTALLLTALLISLSFFSLPAYAALGDFLYKWGSYGSGEGQFISPVGLALDSSGNVYVTEAVNNRVQVFSKTGTFIRAWGTYGSGDGQFNPPYGIAVDSSGNVYVADVNNYRIQVFSNTGTFLRSWATYDPDGWGLNYGYFGVGGIAVDANGDVYVTDYSMRKVHVFSNTGTLLRKWGSYGLGDGQFFLPFGIAVDANRNVYVTDMVNNRVQVFTNTGTFLRAWGNHGSGDGQFDLPSGIAVDSSGNVYVADRDNYRVQVFNNAGVFLGKWGSFGSGDGQFLYPWGIAIDSIGNVYVLDFGNYRVQVFGGYSATNIDTTPPTVTVSANPNVLWPPNNKMVDIEIDGSATDEGSGIASIVITVTDEYGVYNMTVPGFGSTIRLEASRKGTDKDGRVYTITAVATDNAGNQATATTTVIVPHDQR